ncbi:helix-turn-helix transcriptional regulator [candidate division KSB1 bacterium]
MKLVNRLKVWRAEKNITQDELAKAVNLSRQTVNAVERGKFVPSVLTAIKMAKYFETNIESIFFTKEEEDDT